MWQWPLYDTENKQMMAFDEFDIHPEKEFERKIHSFAKYPNKMANNRKDPYWHYDDQVFKDIEKIEDWKGFLTDTACGTIVCWTFNDQSLGKRKPYSR